MKLAFARLFGGEDTYDAVLDKSGITETLKKTWPFPMQCFLELKRIRKRLTR